MKQTCKEECALRLRRARLTLRREVEVPLWHYYTEANLVLDRATQAFERGEMSPEEVGEVMREPTELASHIGLALGWTDKAPHDNENGTENLRKGNM